MGPDGSPQDEQKLKNGRGGARERVDLPHPCMGEEGSQHSLHPDARRVP